MARKDFKNLKTLKLTSEVEKNTPDFTDVVVESVKKDTLSEKYEAKTLVK